VIAAEVPLVWVVCVADEAWAVPSVAPLPAWMDRVAWVDEEA